MLDPFSHSRFLPEHKLLAWHPEGILDVCLASQMIDFVTFQELVLDEPFNRFANWEKITEVKLNFLDVTDLAASRRKAYNAGPSVKSAFLATNPAAYGIALAFAGLMSPGPILVRVFRDIEAAGKWLGVPIKALEPE